MLADIGSIMEAVRPWLSTGSLVGLAGLAVKLWLDNKKLTIDSESGIRDHYAQEVASLRAQVLAVQTAADARVANAEKRYEEAIASADARHHVCEQECDRLRDRMSDMQTEIDALNRRIGALNAASLRLFEPKTTLPDALRDQMKSFEQEGMTGREDDGDHAGNKEPV